LELIYINVGDAISLGFRLFERPVSAHVYIDKQQFLKIRCFFFCVLSSGSRELRLCRNHMATRHQSLLVIGGL
jgi:hypothetical protein